MKPAVKDAMKHAMKDIMKFWNKAKGIKLNGLVAEQNYIEYNTRVELY